MKVTSEHIYQAAKQKNLRKLNLALPFVSIDVYREGTFESALTQLAKECDLASVEFLLKHGAENNFAALGAVMSVDRAWQNMFLSMDKSTMVALAKGFAQSGNRELTERLIELGVNPAVAVFGAALGKHFDWVDGLLLKFKTPASVGMAAKAAAIVGDQQRVNLYRSQEASLDLIAQGIGISADIVYASDFAKENPDYRNALAIGFAIGGYPGFSMHFCDRDNMNPIAFGAAMRGDKAWVNELKKHPSVKWQCIFIGAVLGGHLQWAELLRHEPALIAEKKFLKERHADLIGLGEEAFFESSRLIQASTIIGYSSNHAIFASATPLLPEIVFSRARENAPQESVKKAPNFVFFPPIHRKKPPFSRRVRFQKEESESTFSLSS